MTFENVLEVFGDYLREDTDLEIVLTKRGYTVMCWDNTLADWSNTDFCATPEKLRDSLLDFYMSYAELKMTNGQRDLTSAEKQQIQNECDKFRRLCDEASK